MTFLSQYNWGFCKTFC